MNLASCDSCGVVVDRDKLDFQDFWNKDGSVIFELAEWSEAKTNFVAKLPCPVCEFGSILKE
jgi:hypothetical protein